MKLLLALHFQETITQEGKPRMSKPTITFLNIFNVQHTIELAAFDLVTTCI